MGKFIFGRLHGGMSVQTIGTIFLILLLIHLFRTWWPLRRIPGPFWAKFTNLQRVAWVKSGHAHLIFQKMHNKYGAVVRMGPNMVSVSDPKAIPTIYPMRAGVPKGDFYTALRAYSRKGGALKLVFNTQDEETTPIFASSITKYEPMVDDVLAQLQKQLNARFVKTGATCDLGDWIQYFAFDVMGTMTFSKRYGFLDDGKDENGMIEKIFDHMKTAAPMTQVPWLDKYLYKNWIVDAFRRTPGLAILKFVNQVIAERQKSVSEGKPAKGAIYPEKDLLARYLEIQTQSPEIPSWAATAWVFTNVIAGSDSVGAIIRTTMFNLLMHRRTLEKLLKELLEAQVSQPYPTWEEVRELPYLDACVQEGARMHPPFALPLERRVPAGGMDILGHYLPEGTAVGGNPYVMNRHEATFGQDAEIWRPERWLDHDGVRKKKLEQSTLTFGAGRRICLGRHLGMLEIKKCIPFLVMNFDLTTQQLQIVDPHVFTVENAWFFKQTGFYARLHHRGTDSSV
ncbi:hypothetical protein RRF57_003996 [Xylaria bambusicola]|uniref:Cytochrome P450 n=1 Tax=Xylaria bambusicola TaxID=326684 RepID=A0AAN7Z827_9PEZI